MAFVLLWDEDTGDIWWGEWVITFKKNALGDVDLLVVVVCFSFFLISSFIQKVSFM